MLVLAPWGRSSSSTSWRHEGRHGLYRRHQQPGRPGLAAQKNHAFPNSFTARHKVERLVWYEVHETAVSAIQREKRIKDWLREWKDRLIEEKNPTWRDLSHELGL